MKITGTNTYVEIETEARTVRFAGELLVGGFVAFIESARLMNGETLTMEALNELVEAVKIKTKDSHMVITFE